LFGGEKMKLLAIGYMMFWFIIIPLERIIHGYGAWWMFWNQVVDEYYR